MIYKIDKNTYNATRLHMNNTIDMDLRRDMIKYTIDIIDINVQIYNQLRRLKYAKY